MSYLAFIRHLVAKDPGRIRTKVLPFEGKNICVYALPVDELMEERANEADDLKSCSVCAA